MRNGKGKDQDLSELLNSRCTFWPSCLCGQTMEQWQAKLKDDDFVFNGLEDLRAVDLIIFSMLSCVAHNCPEKKFRNYASQQLLNKWWDHQREGREIDLEFIRQRRAARQ